MAKRPVRPHDWLGDGEGHDWCTRCGVKRDEAAETISCPAEGM